jgi:tetratricopeptide (TPR) repeat protein
MSFVTPEPGQAGARKPENSDAAPEHEAGRFLEEGEQFLAACDQLYPAPAIAQCDRALATFKRARELVGDDQELKRATRWAVATAYSQRGHQRRYARQHAEALTDLTEALALNPTLAEDYYYRALSYLAQGDQISARADLIEYLKRGENDFLRDVAKERLAGLVPDQADSKATLKHWYSEGVRLNTAASNAAHPPGDAAEPEWAKAVALYNRAITAFDRALEANPNDMLTKMGLLAALIEQAEGYRYMEEYDLALENYRRAQQVRPQSRHIFLQGETWLEIGNMAQAYAAFEDYLKQGNDPTLRAQAQKYLQARKSKGGS